MALAIVGSPGAGKSTLAALLCAAGARLVADDALRVDATDSGAVCFPGSRGLRLEAGRREPRRRGSRGRRWGRPRTGGSPCVPARSADAPLRLGAVLVPEPSREARTLQVRRLGAMEGLQELLRYPRLTMWRASEPIGRLFELTAEVAQGLPVYRATVPWGPPFPRASPRGSWRALASARHPSARAGDRGAVSASDRRGTA